MTKRFKQFMSALVLAALVLSLTGQVVKATSRTINDRDYEFYFNAPWGYVYDYSEMQSKYNANSAWVACDDYNDAYAYRAVVIGADSYGTYREDIRLYSVQVYPGDTNVRIYNWVYENDLPFAILRGEADSDAMYWREGTWEANYNWGN
ncbi:MAG: hypothetical protein IKL73_06195 [Lachnospiraceae bacterium]|nr:hypothetical protein [Lachnospiraceae bacterium]